jgi:hypothetical protein
MILRLMFSVMSAEAAFISCLLPGQSVQSFMSAVKGLEFYGWGRNLRVPIEKPSQPQHCIAFPCMHMMRVQLIFYSVTLNYSLHASTEMQIL